MVLSLGFPKAYCSADSRATRSAWSWAAPMGCWRVELRASRLVEKMEHSRSREMT
jgi:hypothetical protein